MGFAQNLEYLMQKNAMTKYQLAKKVGCHQTSITNWLENGTIPQKRTIEAVASAFGVSSVDLCGENLPQHKQKNAPTPKAEQKEEPALHEENELTSDRIKKLLESMPTSEIINLMSEVAEELKRRG